MKWIALIVATTLLTSCGLSTTKCIEYRQVIAGGPVKTSSIFHEQPVDVSTTRVEFY